MSFDDFRGPVESEPVTVPRILENGTASRTTSGLIQAHSVSEVPTRWLIISDRLGCLVQDRDVVRHDSEDDENDQNRHE